ncbi:hypothetical protein J2S11_000543 [Bacillus horti]|uniref:Uncharacterized protein n=1 Tax=Caldalkalibacillus horti TaxID=77523 RepID=A0ABT9VUI6_9BACI|nr:hypothetical protein [Bacillus horti]
MPQNGGDAYEFFAFRSDYAWNVLPRCSYLFETKITCPG